MEYCAVTMGIVKGNNHSARLNSYSYCHGSSLKLELSLMTKRPVLILGWQPHHWWRYLWCGE